MRAWILMLLLIASPAGAEWCTGAIDLTEDDSLFAWYRMEQSSGVASDSSGNGNDTSSCNGALTASSSVFKEGSRSFYRDQATNRANIIVNGSVSSNWCTLATDCTSSGLSWGAWVYRTTDSGAREWLIWSSFALSIESDDKIGCLIQPWDWAYSNSAIELNTWYHVSCIYNGSTTKLRLNGVDQTDTAGGPATSSTDDFAIGNNKFCSNQGLRGYVDDMFFFDRALTDAESDSIMNCGLDGRGLPIPHRVDRRELHVPGAGAFVEGDLQRMYHVPGGGAYMETLPSAPSIVTQGTVTAGAATFSAAEDWTASFGGVYLCDDSGDLGKNSADTDCEMDLTEGAGGTYTTDRTQGTGACDFASTSDKIKSSNFSTSCTELSGATVGSISLTAWIALDTCTEATNFWRVGNDEAMLRMNTFSDDDWQGTVNGVTEEGVVSGCVADTWAHVALTRAAGTDTPITLYVDGAEDCEGGCATTNDSTWETFDALFLGGGNGSMDEATWVEDVLTPEEVCRICSCGVDGSLCLCNGQNYVSAGRNSTYCSTCTLPACNAPAP